MEENNVMTYEEVIENTEVIEANEEPEETTGNGSSIGALVLIGGAVIGGAVAIHHFTKKKREAWAVKRLEKKGYVVSKPEVNEPIEEVECDELEESK